VPQASTSALVCLELSFGEQFVSVSVAGEGGVFRIVEHIKVGSDDETISFTRIYHRC
jgi:hypothetical protein